jgi:translation initiation factor eIF-2B subunit delta
MIDETVAEIREMQTHSSSAVAVKAVRALASLCDREYAAVEEFLRALERNGSALRRANPSHASLYNAVTEVVDAVEAADPTDLETARERTREAVAEVVEAVENAKERAADRAADLLADGTTLLTHDYSTTVLSAVETATDAGRSLTVYVTEARPRHLGRKTARRLAAIDGVETHLITDAACGHYLPNCEAVLVGMDCIVGDTLYNRVGTFPVAATARRLGVPLTVVGSGAKVVEDGFVFENDFRSPSEVMREPPEGFTVENPAYDATPVELVDRLVTDEGVREP